MTLQQIAERAGVSTPTISKVLNGRPDVAPATRERVLQVLHEQQYLPRGASALPSVNKHVELVFDALKNPNNLEILREIVKAAGEHGGHVAVSTVPENMNARRWIHELERVGRAGVIMVTSRLTPEQQRRLQEAALPLVLIDPINSVDGPVPSVGATNWQQLRVAARENITRDRLRYLRKVPTVGVSAHHAGQRPAHEIGSGNAAHIAADASHSLMLDHRTDIVEHDGTHRGGLGCRQQHADETAAAKCRSARRPATRSK